jgi:hypothetical protein
MRGLPGTRGAQGIEQERDGYRVLALNSFAQIQSLDAGLEHPFGPLA